MSLIMREAARFEIQLIHIHGSLKGEISTFVEDQITIGREHTCSVKFPPEEQGVSRTHATIKREGNQFRLIDNSKYGTFVNGKQAGEGTFIRSGDVLEIGPGGPKISFHAEIIEGAVAEPLPMAVSPPAPEIVRPEIPVQSAPEAPLKVPTISTPPPQPIAPPPPKQFLKPEKTAVPLVIQYGPSIRSYRELPVVIGSDANADFVLQLPGVSGRHLQLFYSRDAYWVKNLTGVNIVTVNHENIDTQVQLKPFDEIECCPGGPTFRFIGEGRLVEVEQNQAAPSAAKNASPSDSAGSPQLKKEEGGFFSKLLKGLKK